MNEEVKIAPKREAPQKTAKRSFILLRSLFAVLMFCGLAGMAYLYIEQDKSIGVLFEQQNQFSQQSMASAAELAELQSKTESYMANLSKANSLIAEQALKVDALNRELISTRLRIKDSGTATNPIWTLAEAESLLRLAQQRLIISQDVRAALALFVASDDILKQINDPAIYSIRNILASEMAALRAITEIDIQGMYLQLVALAQSIDSLSVISDLGQSISTDSAIQNNGENESGFISSVMNTFNRYIVVKRTDEKIQPSLNSEQEFYIKQNIRLQLEQAKLSLLQEREANYRNGIEGAITNINLYLESDGRQKQSIVEALQVLLNSPIVMQVPVLSNSLAALQQILPLAIEEIDETQ